MNYIKFNSVAQIVLIAMLGYLIFAPTKMSVGGGFQQYGLYSVTSTSSSVSLSTDLRLVATGTQNRVLKFTPAHSCTQGFYLSLNNDQAATVANGMFVAASSSFLLSAENRYAGSVRGISNGGTCVVNVTGNN